MTCTEKTSLFLPRDSALFIYFFLPAILSLLFLLFYFKLAAEEIELHYGFAMHELPVETMDLLCPSSTRQKLIISDPSAFPLI